MAAIVLYMVLLVVLTPPLGAYMHRVYARQNIGRVEALLYGLIGVDALKEQTWKRYAACVLWFSLASLILVYLILRLQGALPLNPDRLGSVGPFVAFNTAISFVTNTNWQAYGGESTMSYLSQMLALTFQNFVSAATGMAVLIAMVRGFSKPGIETLGNFWRDLVRGTVYILLPLAAVFGLFLVGQGVVQTLSGAVDAQGLQGADQTVARGPAAGQVAIKQLGTNGGGFFNANSAHPIENPTPISNFLQSFSLLWIGAGLTYTFGKMVGSKRQAWTLFGAMFLLLVAGLVATVPAERNATPAMRAAGIASSAPNLEGKEVRIGADESSLWAVATTAASNGSVNAMHDSFQPTGMIAPMFNMAIGEVVFGGVGSGLYGMVFYVVLAVFLGGLMVGRTPEYLGKKMQAREIKIVVIAILAPFLMVLALTAVAVVLPAGLEGRLNEGPHGFSEIFYAWLSMGNNNGSAFAGLTVNSPFYTVAGGLVMVISRFVPMLAALALGASVARQTTVPFSSGTLRTDTGLFVGLLVGVIVIIGALTFLPALALGPIVEQLSPGNLY